MGRSARDDALLLSVWNRACCSRKCPNRSVKRAQQNRMWTGVDISTNFFCWRIEELFLLDCPPIRSTRYKCSYLNHCVAPPLTRSVLFFRLFDVFGEVVKEDIEVGIRVGATR